MIGWSHKGSLWETMKMNWLVTVVVGLTLGSLCAHGSDAPKPADAAKAPAEEKKPADAAKPPAEAPKPAADAAKPPADEKKPADAPKPPVEEKKPPEKPADAKKPAEGAPPPEMPGMQMSDAVKIENVILGCKDAVDQAMEKLKKKLPPDKEYSKILETDRPRFHILIEEEYEMAMGAALKYYQEKLGVFLKDDVCSAVRGTTRWDQYFICKRPLDQYGIERACPPPRQ